MDSLIERLRTTRLLSQRNQYALQAEAADALEAQQAEIARLREALEQISAVGDWRPRDRLREIRTIARAALNNGEAN